MNDNDCPPVTIDVGPLRLHFHHIGHATWAMSGDWCRLCELDSRPVEVVEIPARKK